MVLMVLPVCQGAGGCLERQALQAWKVPRGRMDYQENKAPLETRVPRVQKGQTGNQGNLGEKARLGGT